MHVFENCVWELCLRIEIQFGLWGGQWALAKKQWFIKDINVHKIILSQQVRDQIPIPIDL